MNVNDWVPVLNTTTETIPSFGVMSVIGDLDEDGNVSVGKPDENGSSRLLVNGEVAIRAGKTGIGTPGLRCVVAYDQADGAPVVGDDWGPGADTWLLKKGNTGFFLWGAAGGVANGLRLYGKLPGACERYNISGLPIGDGVEYLIGAGTGGGNWDGGGTGTYLPRAGAYMVTADGTVSVRLAAGTSTGSNATIQLAIVEAVSTYHWRYTNPVRPYRLPDGAGGWWGPWYVCNYSMSAIVTVTAPTVLTVGHQTSVFSGATIDANSSIGARLGYAEVMPQSYLTCIPP